MECVIFDFDGTLAVIKDRRHFIIGENPDWEAFYNDSINDKPNFPLVKLYKALWAHYPIVICTTRPSKYRSLTEKWMEMHSIPTPMELFMRGTGDHRQDHVVKRQMLQEIRQEGLNPIFAVEDRASVVEMWRECGLVCLQCDPGTFNIDNV